MTARLGIDLGTTNTVVAWADRGNFPVLSLSASGEGKLSIPTLVAWRGAELRIGDDAAEVWNEPGWQLLGSLKRWLGIPEPDPLQDDRAGVEELGIPGGAGARIEELLFHFFERLRGEILACPHLEGEEDLEVVLGVPANANSLQRLRTLAAAERAGFSVLGLMHESTAAAIEYAQRHPGFGKSRNRRQVVVYDLGGGTFDAAVVACGNEGFEVVRSGGVERLGGDDFDRTMAELALAKSRLRWDDLTWTARHRLLSQCRELKESLRSTTKKWLVDSSDLGGDEVALYTEEYYQACLPLIERSVVTLQSVLAASHLELEDADALLLVGGGSQMPLVRRRLKDLFGTRLKISPHPFAATAVGLAVQAGRMTSATVEERFSRHFGVWREREGGARPLFDSIFDPETRLPRNGEKLVITRSYHPAHDIGHFRFEECAELDAEGNPLGDGTPWCEIFFPFDPNIPANDPLDERPVRRSESYSALSAEERYECDSAGQITVRLSRAEPPLARSFLLYGPERVAPLERLRRQDA